MQTLTVIVDKLNKRSALPATLPDPTNIAGIVFKGFTFQGVQVPASALPNASLGSWYKDQDGYYYWGSALQVISSTDNLLSAPNVQPAGLPLSASQCIKCASWMKNSFATEVNKAVQNTPFDDTFIYAIACQETAVFWQRWIDDHTADEILARCVFDASGDVYHNRGNAFPADTGAFIDKFGQDKANILIAEANATRAMRGFSPKQWVYDGYGIFQYDLQYVLIDPDFFFNKEWYSIDNCLSKLIGELNEKWQANENDYFNTVRAYNGSGSKAETYAQNVSQFYTWIKEI